MYSQSNNQEQVQPSETFFHMKSVRFHCTPCNRQFSFLNPENGRARCPRCDNVSTRIVDSNSQNQSRNTSTTTNSNARQNSSQARPQQARPSNQPRAQQMGFSNGLGGFIQTVLPGVYFMQPEPEQMMYDDEQNAFGGMFGFGNMFGMNQNNVFPGFFGNYYSNQQSNQYSTSLFDLLSGQNGGMQDYTRPMYRMGDQYITPEEYERLVEQFIQSDPNNHGPAPASEENIKKLKEFHYDSEACKHHDCSVCQDGYKKGDKCVELPCEHNYHKDCVLEWLKRHDSCPICRKPCASDKMEEEAAC